MGIIKGSLSDDLTLYHVPGKAELAALIIDESIYWRNSESELNHSIKIQSQVDILKKIKELGCSIVTVDMPNNKSLLHANPHINAVCEEVDYEFTKHSTGVLGDKKKKSMQLLSFLQSRNITSLVIMGGAVNACICDSIIGRPRYPGLIIYGYTILSALPILSPYKPEVYQLSPRFHPDAVRFDPTISRHPYDTLFNIIERNWPSFSLHPAVRIYTEV